MVRTVTRQESTIGKDNRSEPTNGRPLPPPKRIADFFAAPSSKPFHSEPLRNAMVIDQPLKIIFHIEIIH